jgi:hypothetical protein
MSDELNRVYEALQKADQAGNTEDAKQLAAYARQLEQTAEKPEAEQKPIEAQLNDIMYPAAGAVAGSTVGGATTAGRIVGGLRNAAKAADPVAMEQARRIAEKNAVETWGRTQHRVPGMVAEKPGLYFGEPTYALEKQRAYNEIQKMATDPEYHAKVLSEQKPAVAQYAKRVAQENPTMMQKVGRVLGRAPMGAIAGGFTGLGAGMQASDAINRYNQGDKLGSAISGVGALGTGLAMIPHPVTRIGGTAVGLGAEGLNAYIDYLKKNNPFDKMTQQPQQQQQPQQMAAGGKVKPLSKAQRAMKHFAEGGSTSAPTIMSGQSSFEPVAMASQFAPESFEPQVAFASQAAPVNTMEGFPQPVAMASQPMEQSGVPIPFLGSQMPMGDYDKSFNPMAMANDFSMQYQAAPTAMPTLPLRNTSPITTRNPFTMASTNVPNLRAPMNPFNPGFAAQRPAVTSTQPRPGMPLQPPRTPVINQFQPTFNSPMGFRSPIAQQRVAAGLSQLPRKPMFRRFAEGGNI